MNIDFTDEFNFKKGRAIWNKIRNSSFKKTPYKLEMVLTKLKEGEITVEEAYFVSVWLINFQTDTLQITRN